MVLNFLCNKWITGGDPTKLTKHGLLSFKMAKGGWRAARTEGAQRCKKNLCYQRDTCPADLGQIPAEPV
ncbi:hypothetical protein NQZ68_023251 [Dissostichus eleginoides]|nr:hypothetical protein NQZ68_023251 [Dissostichus eleginoides]